jgi:hypothetical protein
MRVQIYKYCECCGNKLKFKIKLSSYDKISGKPLCYLVGECPGHSRILTSTEELEQLIKAIPSDINYTTGVKYV